MFKKITIYIVMALLCLNFKAKAQDNKAVDITAKGIQIGQKVPDITITGLHNYKDANGKPATTAKISDFKGKLLILDFWATWCSPCVAMMPRMDSLQRVFGDKVQFLSVTYQKDNEVLPFVGKLEKRLGKHFALPIVTGDQELRGMFPHVYLPHYIWIDTEGVVRAITSNTEVEAVNIENMLKGRGTLERKKDIKMAYQPSLPYLINGNGGDGSNLIFHSQLSGNQIGLASGYKVSRDKKNNRMKITVHNMSITDLFRLSYISKGYLENNRTIRETIDTGRLVYNGTAGNMAEYKKWAAANAYCYELIVPLDMAAGAYDRMRSDLHLQFPAYLATVEKRKKKVYVLKRTSAVDKIKTTAVQPKFSKFSGLGFELSQFPIYRIIEQLAVVYQQLSPYPLADETGYRQMVDMKVEANLTNMESINKALADYDLKFFLEDRDIDCLIIRDNKSK